MCNLFKNVIQKTCDKEVHIGPYFLKIIPDCHKAQGICIRAVKVDLWQLEHVPNNLNTGDVQ